ncbi:SusC/RagA family TonB-linked outer membrane protein [Bacteroidia bacterium]|nr:SusC/RagA family TonB-linked outer membrane protein [Bacteroidia bacterium]
MGMETREVRLNGKTNIRVTLYQSTNVLDDLVVIGYGTAKKSDLTGSVSSVSQETFEEKMITSVEDALRGQVAGVRVMSTEGQPGEDLNIRIRGSGSLNASNSPIYVIDGIVMETTDINSGDIQSMEILKDASATAIYGSRGANGVIIITTKRGAKGKVRVNVALNTSFQTRNNLLDMMDSYEYARMKSNNSINYYSKGTTGIDFNTSSRQFYKDSEGNFYQINTMDKWQNYQKYGDKSNPDYINTNWQNLMIQNSTVFDYRANVSGGDDKSRFSLMGGYLYQPGIVVYNSFEKYTLRGNYEYNINKSSKYGLNINGSRSSQQGLDLNSNISMNMLSQAPTKLPSAEDWEAEDGETQFENNNPLYQAKRIKKEIDKTNVALRAYFDLQLAKGLQLQIAGNLTNNQLQEEDFFPRDVAKGRTQEGKAVNAMTNSFTLNSETLLKYATRFGNKYTFDIMGGAIFEQNRKKMLSGETHGFENDVLTTDAMGLGSVIYDVASDVSRWRMASYLGRANFGIDSRYLFTASIRFDGSSRFGKDNKWGTFPSGAFAWRIDQEKWMKPIRQISSLKLRASAGVSGNSAIPSLRTLSVMTKANYPMDGLKQGLGLAATRSENPDLKWETSIQYDLGLDFGLFKNRISGTVDLYLKQTRDLLFEKQTLYSTGYSSRWSNIAAVDNRGLEITLRGMIVRGRKVNWSANYNMAFNRSRVKSLGEKDYMILNPNSPLSISNYAILQQGLPFGNWYGYQTDGVWRSQAEIDALPDHYSSIGVAKSALHPGSTKFVDVDGNGTVDDADRRIIGCSEPTFTGGLTNVVKFLDFTFTLGLEFVYGGKIFNATGLELSQLNSNAAANQLSSNKGYWQPKLFDITTGEVYREGNESSDIHMPALGWERYLSQRFVEDASYLRISDITLSYDLARNIRQLIRVNKLSVFFSVRNAYIFTGYSGYDPDVSSAKGIYADLVPKLDAGSLPRTRAYTVGVNITF